MLLIDSKELKIDVALEAKKSESQKPRIIFTIDYDGLFFQHEVLQIDYLHDADGYPISMESIYSIFLLSFKKMLETHEGTIRIAKPLLLTRGEIEFYIEPTDEAKNELWIDYKNGGHWFTDFVDWKDVKIPETDIVDNPIVQWTPWILFEDMAGRRLVR